eukprot:2594927-Amphidinium_carterae.1
MMRFETSMLSQPGRSNAMELPGLPENRTTTLSTVILSLAATVASTWSVILWRFITASTSGEHR